MQETVALYTHTLGIQSHTQTRTARKMTAGDRQTRRWWEKKGSTRTTQRQVGRARGNEHQKKSTPFEISLEDSPDASH